MNSRLSIAFVIYDKLDAGASKSGLGVTVSAPLHRLCYAGMGDTLRHDVPFAVQPGLMQPDIPAIETSQTDGMIFI
jgi:hypothetical protein